MSLLWICATKASRATCTSSSLSSPTPSCGARASPSTQVLPLGGADGAFYLGLGPAPAACRAFMSLSRARPGVAHADVEISYVDAILGTTVKVTTLGTNELSEVDLKIPAGGGEVAAEGRLQADLQAVLPGGQLDAAVAALRCGPAVPPSRLHAAPVATCRHLSLDPAKQARSQARPWSCPSAVCPSSGQMHGVTTWST